MVYLDYMATTPVAEGVAEKMTAYLTMKGCYANASAVQYPQGRLAAQAIAEARAHAADLIAAPSAESITFTSGATEANNIALQGVAHAYQHKGKHIVTKSCEHSAVLDCMSALQKQGFAVTYLTPDANGMITPQQLRDAIRPDTILVSLMWVNNEIGVIQDMLALSEVCQAEGVIFHVDAAQAVGKIVVDVTKIPMDLLSFSAHKFYGPKGVGCLYQRPASRLRLQPVMYGGGQERHLRPGTYPTHQIVGLGEAARLAKQNLTDDLATIQSLQMYAWQRIDALEGVIVNGDRDRRVVHNVNFSLPGIDGQTLAKQLGEQHICVATGSACHAADHQPSHVLRALGRHVDLANAALRLSFGRETTQAELKIAFDAIEQILEKNEK